MFRGVKAGHREERDDVPTRPTAQPLKKHCREGNSDVQGSLRSSALWDHDNISDAVVVPDTAVGGAPTGSLGKIKSEVAVSYFAAMYGRYNYNANPFAPLGCEIGIHVMLAQRRMFEEHTKLGYY